MNILLCSVGRRPYLVRWFQEALNANGLAGEVIAADLDATSPARAFADQFIQAPPVADATYKSWFKDLIQEREIELAVSINDFELSEWALLPTEEIWSPVIRLSSEVQALAEDKLGMAELLNYKGVLSPHTWSGAKALEIPESDKEFVTKGRFGSASRGLQFTNGKNLGNTIDIATREVTTRQGVLAHSQNEFHPNDLVIVQEKVTGTEFGLDNVCDFSGTYAGVLARKKIAMRGGETDRAVSVSGEMFEDIALQIADAVPHQGTIDVDVIVDDTGAIYVIDVNPRFGGGYPFSHLAGARIPNAYVAWAAGMPIQPGWLDAAVGVTGSKYVEAVKVS